MSISAVFFDLDETLIADEASYQEAIQATADELTREFACSTADTLVATYDRVSKEVWAKFDHDLHTGTVSEHINGTFIRRTCWQQALADCGITDGEAVTKAVTIYGRLRRETYKLMPGAS